MACSSRNPQNCLAGANDYRTVDIPFPTIGEKITGDAWLGWYTTKNGGLTWRTRLLPGYPQDTSAVGTRVAAQGICRGRRPDHSAGHERSASTMAASSSTATRAAAARSSWRGSSTTTTRKATAANRSRISARRSSTGSARRRRSSPGVKGVRGGPPRATACANRIATTPANARAARRSGAGVEQPGPTSQMVDKPWMAVDVPRAGAPTCSIGGAGTGCPAADVSGRPRLHGLRALRRPGRSSAGASCSALRRTAA